MNVSAQTTAARVMDIRAEGKDILALELGRVALLEGEEQFDRVFGHEFVGLYSGLKRGEFETFMQVISPWEREFLLLNV